MGGFSDNRKRLAKKQKNDPERYSKKAAVRACAQAQQDYFDFREPASMGAQRVGFGTDYDYGRREFCDFVK
jgi:hypothetical protein